MAVYRMTIADLREGVDIFAYFIIQHPRSYISKYIIAFKYVIMRLVPNLKREEEKSLIPFLYVN